MMINRLFIGLTLVLCLSGALQAATVDVDATLTNMEGAITAMKGVVNGNIPWNSATVNSPDTLIVVKAAINGKVSQFMTYTTMLEDYYTQLNAWEDMPGFNPTQVQVNRMVALRSQMDLIEPKVYSILDDANTALAWIAVVEVAMNHSADLLNRARAANANIDVMVADMVNSGPQYTDLRDCNSFVFWLIFGGFQWIDAWQGHLVSERTYVAGLIGEYQSLTNLPAWVVDYYFGDHPFDQLAGKMDNWTLLWHGTLWRISDVAQICGFSQDTSTPSFALTYFFTQEFDFYIDWYIERYGGYVHIPVACLDTYEGYISATVNTYWLIDEYCVLGWQD